MKLYDFCRSSASYRLRIALNIKGVSYDQVPVNLRKGEQNKAEYLRMNPQGLVPVLNDGSIHLSQSLAIIEWLEETYPSPRLLPDNSTDKAYVRGLSQIITCDIHPLNNLRVLKYLEVDLAHDKAEVATWAKHWINIGFSSLEVMLSKEFQSSKFCYGDTPTIADICLVPQIANAKRFNIDMSTFPTLMRINESCMLLEAFAKAAPENQSDFT